MSSWGIDVENEPWAISKIKLQGEVKNSSPYKGDSWSKQITAEGRTVVRTAEREEGEPWELEVGAGGSRTGRQCVQLSSKSKGSHWNLKIGVGSSLREREEGREQD